MGLKNIYHMFRAFIIATINLTGLIQFIPYLFPRSIPLFIKMFHDTCIKAYYYGNKVVYIRGNEIIIEDWSEVPTIIRCAKDFLKVKRKIYKLPANINVDILEL